MLEYRGILLADTKFEFGTDADGRLYVMDEILTPDSVAGNRAVTCLTDDY